MAMTIKYRCVSLILGLFCGVAAYLSVTTVVNAQEPVPHPMVDTSLCRSCHLEGKNNAPIMPDDHADYEGVECQECHAANAEDLPAAPGIPHSLVARTDCLRCHARGIGGSPVMPEDHEGRENDGCQLCHAAEGAPTQVETGPTPAPTPLAEPIPVQAPEVAGPNYCVECHRDLDGTSSAAVTEWEQGVHAEHEIGCEGCHGGDPNVDSNALAKLPQTGYIGVPDPVSSPGVCASCHADPVRMFGYDIPTDQFAKYQESFHGKALYENNDENVATCVTCHGAHRVLEVNDPSADVYPLNVPALCANCHADAELMSQYNLPTDQYELYQHSVHGVALLEEQELSAPTCATCHGTHGAAPPGVSSVPNVCGSCHSAVQDYYAKSAHAEAGFAGPECVNCHGQHDVVKPDEDLFVGPDERHCSSCHAPDTEIGQEVALFHSNLVDADSELQEANEAVEEVADLGIIVIREETLLLDAWTQLITARAAQHQIDLDLLTSYTDESIKASQEAKGSAALKQAQSVFRRQAMGVAVIIIIVTIAALIYMKRDLDRRLDA